MYLNKLLFPGSHHRYQAKQFENELFFVTREKYPKNFKISRKEIPKSPEKKGPNSPPQKRFSSLFRCSKTIQSENKGRKNVEALYLEPNPCNKTVFRDPMGSPEKSEDPGSTINMPSFLRLGSLRREQGLMDSPTDIRNKGIDEYGKDVKKSEEKIKKKKAKTTCWSFLPKMHKDKKMFDGSNEPIPFELNFVHDLKELSPELIEVVRNANQNPVETEKESSSDSEDEANSNSKKFVQIPCLYLKARVATNKTLLYFHGNGEDLCTSYDFFKNLSNNLMVNIIAIEYPGYGVYSGSPSEKKVLIDAEAVYNHLVNNFQIKEEDIFIFGRSIGSGPATWLASVKNPGLLVLMSPFTSVKAVAKHIGGNLAKYLVKQRFNNIEFMEDVRCPVFIIHGKKDTLIPCSQAMQLYDVIKGKKKIYLAEEMTHSAFDFFIDISVPLTQWLKELNLFSFESSLQDISKTFSHTQANIENIVSTQRNSLKLNEKCKGKELL